MAMVACKECGKEISSKADKCPHCGVKIKRTSRFAWLMAVLSGLVLLSYIMSEVNAPSSGTTKATTKRVTIDTSPEAKAKREKLIQDLLNKEVFQKIEVPGLHPRVWVTPMFYALDFDTKQSFVSVVYAHYLGDEELGSVNLVDSKTGKNVGRFSVVSGLEME
jgi:hypothetical protein